MSHFISCHVHFIHFIAFMHACMHSFISFRFISSQFIASLTHSFLPSFIHSCMHASIHPSIHSKFQFNSAHFNSIQFNSNQFNSIFHSFSLNHSCQLMSFQPTNNSYKQTGSYSHVLILKLAPRRVLGTTWT